jgi:predicted nuclease with TOPRIM domain
MQVANKLLTYERADLRDQMTTLQAENAALQRRLEQARSNSNAWERRFDGCMSERLALETETLSLQAKVEAHSD